MPTIDLISGTTKTVGWWNRSQTQRNVGRVLGYAIAPPNLLYSLILAVSRQNFSAKYWNNQLTLGRVLFLSIALLGAEEMKIAKLLIHDHNQTVALPKEFQFQGNEVYIKKIGNAVVLISKENPWQTLFDSLELFSEDFMETREQLNLEVREALE